MKTNLTLTAVNSESFYEKTVDLETCFLEELSIIYLNKKRLSAFLTLLANTESFRLIKSQITELQDEISHQLLQLESIQLHANSNGLSFKPDVIAISELESFIISESKDLPIKSNLSLLVYLQMIENKETVSVKKLLSLADLLNYSNCSFILKQSKLLVIDSDKFFGKILFLFSHKMAG